MLTHLEGRNVKPHRIAVIDDECIVVSMLTTWLSQKPYLTVVGTAYNGKDGLALCHKAKPDLVLLDIEMPEMDGLTLAEKILEEVPGTRIIILSSHCDPYHVYEISRLKIHGYVEKTCSLETLERTICDVLNGEESFSEGYVSIKHSQLKRADAFHKILTPREISVLMMIADGLSDEEIAIQLAITPNTVATHRRNLRLKIEAHNDRDLINYARQWGLISLDASPSSNPPPPPGGS
jgi:DNA-binding NarL/FixJ family response regulator